MAEEFDPNAFRQQMAQGAGPVPAPIPTPIPAPIAPQQSAVPMQGQPQPYVPQQAPQQYAPQPVPQAAPQQYAPQQPAQFQAPQYQGQQQVQQYGQPQGQPQAYQAPQAQPAAQPHFRPQMQSAYDAAQQMSAHTLQGQQMMPQEVQPPKAKTSLFKRKKLKAAAAQMTPQLEGARDMMPNASKNGLSRLIPFLGGLAVGVLGTLVAIMLFSGNEPQRANIAMTGAQAETATDMPTGQMALTDEMLMENAGQGGEP